MARKNRDPIIITARFQSRCKETGKLIKKGEQCIYYPASKSVFHIESKQAEIFKQKQFDNYNIDQEAQKIGLL